MIKKAIFKNKDGLIISSCLHIPDVKNKKAIIYCHGMEGSKDGAKALYFADEFCKLGYYFMRFDFRYAGESEDKFENITISGERDDLEAAYNYLKKNIRPDEIILIASSLGCAAACAFLSHDFDIKKLVLLAPPFDFKTLIKEWFGKFYDFYKKQGYIEKEGKRINYTFASDAYSFDFKTILKKIDCPVLFIHGDDDKVVDYKNSVFGFDYISSQKKKLIKIEGGAHDLNNSLDFILSEIKDFLNG